MTHLIPPPHAHDHLTHPRYRPDIDGLRAVAILSVITFHAFPGRLPGGFVVVDIFFVISGFLISTIIMGSLERGSFSFLDFYTRRVRRIFPALAVVLIATFAFGWHTLLADEFRQLGKHIASGAGFISNLVLWSESGYFDNAADTKPLLHLWSLGVEEQYYLLWPLLLWMAWKRRLNLLAVAAGLFLVSLVVSFHEVRADSVAAFYFPHSRFWELLAGSMLAYLSLHRKVLLPNLRERAEGWLGRVFRRGPADFHGSLVQNAQSLAGAVFIAAGFILITKDRHFPAPWATLPVLGAVLLIAAGPHALVNRLLLSNRLMVWVGLISYPLYLWHWPLLAFARIISGEVPPWPVRLAAIPAAILLAWLTYRLVEKPVRSGNLGNIKAVALASLMAVVGFTGYNAYQRDGYTFRPFQEKFRAYAESMVRSDREHECLEGAEAGKKDWFCRVGHPDVPPKFFVFGDSHALSLLPALEKFSNDTGSAMLFAGESACPPLLGVQLMQNDSDKEQRNCGKFDERVFDYVKEHRIPAVILAARWAYYTGGTTRPQEVAYLALDLSKSASEEYSRESFRKGLETTIARFEKIGVHVLIVEDNPQQVYSPADAIRRHMLTGEPVNQFSVTTSEHLSDQQWVSGVFRQVGNGWARTLNTDDILCDDHVCPLMKDGRLVYFDDDHLSIDGAMLVYPKLAAFLSENEAAWKETDRSHRSK